MTTTDICKRLVIVASVALAACSGSDAAPPPLDTEAPTTTAEQSDTVAPDTTPEVTTTTTTTVATTVIVATTPTTPPETSTTTAPSTTAAPIDEEELAAEIEADLKAGDQALLAAVGNPNDANLRSELANYFTGTSLERATSTLDDLAARGLLVRDGIDVQSDLEVTGVTTMESNAVLARICVLDSRVVYQPASSTQDEIIINDRVVTEIVETLVEFDGTTWLAVEGTTLSETVGVQPCE